MRFYTITNEVACFMQLLCTMLIDLATFNDSTVHSFMCMREVQICTPVNRPTHLISPKSSDLKVSLICRHYCNTLM